MKGLLLYNIYLATKGEYLNNYHIRGEEALVPFDQPLYPKLNSDWLVVDENELGLYSSHSDVQEESPSRHCRHD